MPKTIFVTGASSGIGKATVDLFSERGWQVVATMRNPDAHTEMNHRPNVLILPLDVTDTLSIARAIEAAVIRFGRIDVLLNNAGYGMFGVFELADDEQIEAQFNTNVFGLMRVTKAILPMMRQQRSGTIINVSSIVGRLTSPLYSLYSSTKFAVEGFSETLYYELRPFGIKIKLIEPGPIQTEFNGRSKVEITLGPNHPYSNIQAKVNAFYGRSFKNADTAQTVANTIYKAANSRTYRLRYVSGVQGKLFMALARILPLWKFRWMQRMMIGI
jgi:NAD(P)-dependent dehydrogenase (short-subunit alcohol dehydrogenase family)